MFFFFFSSRRRHTRWPRDWSSDVCSSDLELSRINNSIKSGEFYKNPALVNAFTAARERGRIHFMGLFSDGGVHSHSDHLYALMEMANQQNLEQAYLTASTDCQNSSPKRQIH